MCRMCEIRDQVEKLTDEMQFRIMQYQKEKRYDKDEAAKESQRRAIECLESVFPLLEEAHRFMSERSGSITDMLQRMKDPSIH